MHGSEPDNFDPSGILQEIFSKKLEPIHFEKHPSDGTLTSYVRGSLPKGWRSPDAFVLASQSTDEARVWQRAEVTTHLLTCPRCRQRLELLREESAAIPRQNASAWLEKMLAGLRQRLNPVPRPALATMAIQFFVIAVLAALLIAQPGISNLANPQGTASTATSALSALPEPSPVFNPNELSSFSTWDPQARMATAKELKQSADIRLLEPIVNAWANEEDPSIQKELWDAIISQLSRTQGQLSGTMQKIQQLTNQFNSQGDFPSADSFDDFRKSFDEIYHQFQDLSAGLGRQEIYCGPTSSLSLSQMQQVLRDTGAKIVIDSFGPEGSFKIQLPTINSNQALQQIVARLLLDCSNN